MGRHRRDELDTPTIPTNDQIAAAWRTYFPCELVAPHIDNSHTNARPQDNLSIFPIRDLNTLKETVDTWVFNFTRGAGVVRYADVTDSGLPASDYCPMQVLATMPTKTSGPVTLIAALAPHPVHEGAYHVQMLVCKGDSHAVDSPQLHHTVVCALGVLPTRPALGFIVKDIWNNAGAYLRGRRAFMHTISLDDTHPALPVATRYKIGYEATPPAGLYQP
jgi:hypothetical protein